MGTAGHSLGISSEVPALPAACGWAMSSPPVFLGIQHTWRPLPAGVGILGKTMAPAGLRVPHAAAAKAHGSQAPATGWAQGWSLNTRGFVQAMGRSGKGCSRQREWQRQSTRGCPVCRSDNRAPEIGILVSCSCFLDPTSPEISLPSSVPFLPCTAHQLHIIE